MTLHHDHTEQALLALNQRIDLCSQKAREATCAGTLAMWRESKLKAMAAYQAILAERQGEIERAWGGTVHVIGGGV